jgi:hypothetical protein
MKTKKIRLFSCLRGNRNTEGNRYYDIGITIPKRLVKALYRPLTERLTSEAYARGDFGFSDSDCSYIG